MFSSALVSLFVSNSKNTQKTTRPIFTEFSGQVVRWPWKKRLDFDGNPDRVTLGLG